MSVLYIGCMVPIWGVAVRLSYIRIGCTGCIKVNHPRILAASTSGSPKGLSRSVIG